MKRFGLMRLTAVALTALVLSLSGGISDAHAWWDAKWQFRKKISFDTTDKGAAIKDNVADVPVLLRLHAGNFVFDNAKPDGSDIRVVASDDKIRSSSTSSRTTPRSRSPWSG